MPFENGFIDVRSDTVTQPTQEMRKAMYKAEVGDDFYRDDPTVNRLQEKAAELLGKEDALFVTSGTLGNLISLTTQSKRGDEIIMESQAHVWKGEAGNFASVSGLSCNRVNGAYGIMDPTDVENSIRGAITEPRTSIILIETTNNYAGGTVIPRENIAAIAQIAQNHKMALHIDGARLFNSTVALGISPKKYVDRTNSVMFCLSKSLCCPFGSLITGSKSFIDEARHWRIAFGGTLRQAGIMAAAGLVALDSMIDRLSEDHVNARRLAEGLIEHNLAKLDIKSVQTNMIRASFAQYKNRKDLTDFMFSRGINIRVQDNGDCRLVTHYWVSSKDIDIIISALREYSDHLR
jgi:threonine aldolase